MEERLKQPCLRYFSGYCKFELFCKNSHFTKKQLEKLEKLGNVFVLSPTFRH